MLLRLEMREFLLIICQFYLRSAHPVRVGWMRVFGYQHVGIGNTKVSRWGCCPSTSGFALQWNIGFTIQNHVLNDVFIIVNVCFRSLY